MFAGEPATGPAQPGLNLIENEERAALLAELAHELEELVLSGNDAALSLDYLEDHGRGRVADRLVHGV